MDRGELFSKLESLRHITPGVQTSLFEQKSGNPGTEYWTAIDLQQLCGIENMPWRDTKTDMYESMLGLIGRVSGRDINNTYTLTQSHIISQTSPAGKKTHDMKMSRYASWALTVENKNMPFMRAYFMMPGADIQTISNIANTFTRIDANNRLARCTRHISAIISRGQMPFNNFYANLHSTFFGAVSIDELKAKNGIKITPKDSIHNYMGISSMTAMADGIDAIIHRYDRCERHNSDILSGIAIEEMRNARHNLIEKINRSPAQDITKTSAQDARAELKRLQLAFTKEYQSKTLQ